MIHCCRPCLDLDPMFGPGPVYYLGKQPGIQARAKSKRSEPSIATFRGSFMRTGNNEMTNQRTLMSAMIAFQFCDKKFM